MDAYRTHRAGEIGEAEIGKIVKLAGWAAAVRDHGGLIFVDLRDASGVAQVVFDPKAAPEAQALAKGLSAEDVLSISGEVGRRPTGTENPAMPSGKVEVRARSLEVLNESDPLPFPLEEKTEASEEVRLKYRHLDLRRPGGRKGLDLRHAIMHAARNFLSDRGFMEIETPILWKPTPEGAREFVVPSRMSAGKFYVLPQSPQLVKQTLMVAGVEKYFQIARCFRDEDLRADRQPEFTQIDIEMSFVTEDDVMGLTEELTGAIFQAAGATMPSPVPRLKYREAMEKYGTDKPDLRFKLEIADVGERIKTCGSDVIRKALEKGERAKALALPVRELPRSQLDELDAFAKESGAKGLSWFQAGEANASPLMKRLSDQERDGVARDCGAERGQWVFVALGPSPQVEELMGALRLKLAHRHGMVGKGFSVLWVGEFPLFVRSPEAQGLEPSHHPFTRPYDEDLDLLDKHPDRARCYHYDFVINGTEIWSGSLRIHKPELQRRIFKIIGMAEKTVEERFGFLMRAFSHGAPPHGGIACGLDRLTMLLGGFDSIRETIAFPKTQRGVCLLSEAPGPVDEAQLKELHVRVELPKKPQI